MPKTTLPRYEVIQVRNSIPHLTRALADLEEPNIDRRIVAVMLTTNNVYVNMIIENEKPA